MDDNVETVTLQSVTEASKPIRPRKEADALSPGSSSGYDPHAHRQPEHPTNNFETLVHLLKCALGTGILAMPKAFSDAGMIIGSVALVLIGIIITHCLLLLVHCQNELCKRNQVPLLKYPDAMKEALLIGPEKVRCFAKAAGPLVNGFNIFYQLGICCVYILFMAKNLKMIVDPLYSMHLYLHMLILLLPLILINCIRNLKLLAPFSLLANILTLVGLAIVIYFVSVDKKDESEINYWGTIVSFPLFFGTSLFALTSVGVVIALENNMKSPKAFGGFCGVLTIGMIIIVFLYVLIGVMGYNYCRGECSDVITLDLPKGALATSVVVMYIIAILISYSLHCYVPVDIIWNTYLLPVLQRKGSQRTLLWEYGVRISICLFTFVVAMVVPKLGGVISLAGALCLSALAMVFPALMDVCIRQPSNFGFLKLILVKDIVLFVVGLVGLTVGTFSAIKDMAS